MGMNARDWQRQLYCLLKKKRQIFYNLKPGEFGNPVQNSWKYHRMESASTVEKEKMNIKNNHVNKKNNMYNWIILLYIRSWHNIINQLYFHKIK